MQLGKKYTFPNLVALPMIPVHMNVQFAGLLLEEQPKQYAFNTKKTKIKENNPVFISSHLYSICGDFTNSCSAEAPCTLPIGAVILHLR